MKRVGILHHHARPRSAELSAEVAAWLEQRGHEAVAGPQTADGLDLLVVLGGDGTMLHGIRLVGSSGVPVLGVNLGRLGFLTEAAADEAVDAVERTLNGDCFIDERSTVEAWIERGSGARELLGEAINEVSVERAVGGKLIYMALTIAGQPFTRFGADGLIVATPTGSTAYAFSMRGPVVATGLRSLVVVAVGAHNLFDRPLVLSPDQDVEVALEARGTGVVVTDGRPGAEIGEGDVLHARVGPSVVRLVRLSPDSFFTRVARRFGLPQA
ncbi:MAG TPA: NAD(+)/NADH kinase [Actinomycetota bacterium]|nr:NAD(+)/NADH kinase [Actinomycetota bacterium]